MSRQNRAVSGTLPASGNNGNDGQQNNNSIPTPVIQQAQQYLEENIKAWIQPSPQVRSREEMAPLPLLSMVSPADSYNPYHHSLSRTLSSGASTSGITHQALAEHNVLHQQQHHHPRTSPSLAGQQQHVVPRVPPLTSPSSGYSEHSDPYFALSLAGACDSSGGPSSKTAFPHSLSFGGCSSHSLLQGTSYSSPCGNSFGISQPSAAASFFARAAQRLNLSTKKKRRAYHPNDPERPAFRTNFSDVIKLHPPPVPPGLLRITGRKDGVGVGKVKVMLRIFPSNETSSADSSYMTVDSRKKQLTLYDPTACGSEPSGERHSGIAAPKMFAFDAVFSPDDNQAEVCSSSLCDVISSVVGGSDGCLFVYGHSKLGKTSTMVGNSNSVQELGVIPCAIWWLFRAINEQKHRTGARFSVRVSAVEVSGKVEELRDLLADYAAGTEGSGSAPGVYLRDDPVFGTQLMNQSELRAPTAERATYLLDAALAARTQESEEDARNAHFLFTLHVYQYRVEKGGRGGVAGGRSRLHLFDLGSCEKMSKSRDGGTGGCLSLSALGNVILALFNGQKHVPYKDSKLTQLLREALGSVTCRAAMIAHVSSTPSRYPETLATLQLASRIHRLRRKKLKFNTSADVAAATATGSDERAVCRPFVRLHVVGEDGVRSGSSDPDYTSSSEQSCDTVIFVGTGRGTPMPDHGLSHNGERHHVTSPLAKDGRNGGCGGSSNIPVPGTSKRQTSKQHSSDHLMHHAAKESPLGSSAVSGGGALPSKESKTLDNISKSALNNAEHVKSTTSASPKKKPASSNMFSSPKHQKTVDTTTNASTVIGSPKSSKHVSCDYVSDAKKNKHPADAVSKNSLTRTPKASTVDQLQKTSSSSTSPPITTSPQSPRKSKRSHKQDHSVSLAQHAPFQHQNTQNSSGGSPKLPPKEIKLASDETWIDGPRFTKPKFDSRTLHQLQKEKWVDGPGMYGYMDVHKETMIRRWVEDHSRLVPEEKPECRKEVWIDFPPESEDKSLLQGILEYVPSSSELPPAKHPAFPSPETQRKDTKNKNFEKLPQQLVVVEVESHHYAKPNATGSKNKQTLTQSHKHLGLEAPLSDRHPQITDKGQKSSISVAENFHSGNANEPDGPSQGGDSRASDENSNCSADFNDNESGDLKCNDRNDVKTYTAMESDTQVNAFRRYSNNSSIEGITLMQTEQYTCDNEESVVMVDSCIQVTEEDIFVTCGWPPDSMLTDPYTSARDGDSLDGNEHPLRILSAEDLNLASTFSDSRTVSVDLDSISVPETWTDGIEYLDPSLTWRLLKGNSLRQRQSWRTRDHVQVPNVNKDVHSVLKDGSIDAKLDHLHQLQEIMKNTSGAIETPSTNNSKRTNDKSWRDNRFNFSNKLHHSADSSLEELRENDANSIHSEPAELDIEKLEFHFNIKPMNGLRLEAFYNSIHKVPLFPDGGPQFGKPTQVVPPIIKQQQQHRFSPTPKDDIKSLKDNLKSSKEQIDSSDCLNNSSRQRKKWSNFLKSSSNDADVDFNVNHSKSEVPHITASADTGVNEKETANATLSSQCEDGCRNYVDKIEKTHRRSLTEIILEQRCLMYSEGLSSSRIPVHYPGRQQNQTPVNQKCAKGNKITLDTTVFGKTSDCSDCRHDNTTHKFHPRKKGSPKPPPRSSSNRNGQVRSSKLHHNDAGNPSIPASTQLLQPSGDSNKAPPHQQSGVSTSASWNQSPFEVVNSAPYVMQSHYDTSDTTQVHRNHIMSRSTSTPTSPFMNTCESSRLCAQSEYTVNSANYSYVCSSNTPASIPAKADSKWGARLSSSGHGSDSSVISADIKESKELLGKLPKGQQFSGTSSGYESMPRDSEGTPLSSSSQESSSEVGGKRETRGRKGTRKKPQGSGKRSRSVPARAPVTNSPTWQPLPEPAVGTQVRGRGRLVRDLHDPSLWKSEEDVCCTSLLCCRLLDFY